MADNMARMSESLELSIVYEDGGKGWIVASIPQVPGTHSQGRTRDESRERDRRAQGDARGR